MKLRKGDFYLLQDVSTEKPKALSFYGTQLFRPFSEAALKNGFNVVASRQVNEAGKWPMVEFMAANDASATDVKKALDAASEKLKRSLAIRKAG